MQSQAGRSRQCSSISSSLWLLLYGSSIIFDLLPLPSNLSNIEGLPTVQLPYPPPCPPCPCSHLALPLDSAATQHMLACVSHTLAPNPIAPAQLLPPAGALVGGCWAGHLSAVRSHARTGGAVLPRVLRPQVPVTLPQGHGSAVRDGVGHGQPPACGQLLRGCWRGVAMRAWNVTWVGVGAAPPQADLSFAQGRVKGLNVLVEGV